MKKIIISLSVIAAVAAVAVGATGAFFSDTETSTGNVISAGSLDLTVNGYDTPVPAIVNLVDLKPSQIWWSGPITLQIHNNPGVLYKHIVNEPTNLINCVTHDVTEPECTDQGGLWNNRQCNFLENRDENDLTKVTWFDLEVWVGPLEKPASADPGDNLMCGGDVIMNCWKVKIPDGAVTLAEIASHWIPLGTYGLPGQDNTVTIRQSFHLAGVPGTTLHNLEVPAADNRYQSDSCTFEEEFMVLQTNDPQNAPSPSGGFADSFFDVFLDLPNDPD